MAAEGFITLEELGEKLADLEDTRKVAERELRAVRDRAERVAQLELDKETLLASFAGGLPAALDDLAPKERQRAYRMLRLRVDVAAGGSLDVSGVFGGDLGVCTSETRSTCSAYPAPPAPPSATCSRGTRDTSPSSPTSRAGGCPARGESTVYAATKHATTSEAEGLRMEVDQQGVRVTSIEPGLVRTEFAGSSHGSANDYYATPPSSPSEPKMSPGRALRCLAPRTRKRGRGGRPADEAA